MIKTLEEAIAQIRWLGSIADVCVFRETGIECIGCLCSKFPKPDANDEASK